MTRRHAACIRNLRTSGHGPVISDVRHNKDENVGGLGRIRIVGEELLFDWFV
jgi:hypothetical protein